VVTAPDALVYINGETDIIGCPSCKRKFDLSRYVTSIQTNLDIDSVPGSLTINLSVPRHALDDFYFDGVPLISPMMEVEVFGKGYYLLEGIPQYYPMFWGIVTEVGDSYSSGEHTVSINCADILKWWEICRMNINAAFTAPTPQLGRSIHGNVLFGTNPYDVIFTLAQMSFGDVILATGSLNSLRKENEQKPTFNAALGDIMAYWTSRFSKIRSNLLLYGIQGVAVRGDTLNARYPNGQARGVANFVASAIRESNGAGSQVTFDPASDEVTAFRASIDVNIEFWQNEYQTKLEIANACKEAIGFEFYMDVTGDIVFKPPFYNLDILSNKPVSWVQDIDVISWDFTDSEDEVVTQLTIQGSYAGNTDLGMPAEVTPVTSVTDYHLLRKYGTRPHTYNSEFMGKDLKQMFQHGLDVLDRINSRRHSANVTIPFRPELRMGFPIYIASKDQVWYIRGISHNIQFGGQATTTLSLTARREKFKAPKGISTLKVKSKAKRQDTISETFTDAFKEVSANGAIISDAPGLSVLGSDTRLGPPPPSTVSNSTYELDLGDGASVPYTNLDPADPRVVAAQAPLILRHPKTGRIVGYPNVVMVYSRPYQASPTGYERGQKAPGENTHVAKKDRAKVAQKQAENLREEAKQWEDSAQKNLNKYAHNRYSYGLNTAGVYVYAHDRDKYISQMALLPQKNITIVPDPGGEKSPTTMIRPVSDERGFEVIGHYRYGRGVSLRDGSLVSNAGSTNTRISNQGDLQLALSGGTTALLNAQSQGLTTAVAGGYADPAVALTKLTPEDLQSAGTLTPGTKEVAFTDTGTNFVDSAPLGSPEQAGAFASVEASQFSRALTLAEMSVKFGGIDGTAECECQLGRADLTFISTGYQVRTIKDSAPTYEELLNGGLEDILGQVGSSSSIAPVSPSLKGADLMNRVETYLFNLYKDLDDTHQAHEASLRGGPESAETSQSDLFAPETSVVPGFEPPFSAMNRAALGDPIATALQGKSSREDLVGQFITFGDDLQKSTKAKKLGQELVNLRGRADRLRRRLSQAETRDEKNELSGQIAKTEQEITQKELELSQLTS
jgi:hypothetical protein